MGNCWSCMKEAECGRRGEEETNVVSPAPQRATEPPTVEVVEADLQIKQEPLTVGAVEADLQTKRNQVESSVASTSMPHKGIFSICGEEETNVVSSAPERATESHTVEVVEADLQIKQESPTVGVVEADLQTKQNPVESPVASTSMRIFSICGEEETNVVSSAPERTTEPPTVGVVEADLQIKQVPPTVGVVEADLHTKRNPLESPIASTSMPHKGIFSICGEEETNVVSSAPERATEPPTVGVVEAADLHIKQELPTVGVVEAELQTEQNPVESPVASTSMPQYVGEDVFLGHSGVQKNFVRQLFKDLTRDGVSCFFDESRESLPLAEKWAPRIFEAAETCRVAVLLLSVDFIRSKWPMLELSAFMKAKTSGKNSNLKILPLFYKIAPRDLKDPTSDTQDIPDQTRSEILDKTRNDWKDIPEETRIEWKEALREVRKINGLTFKEGRNKVSFTEEIIKEIRNLLPPSVGLGEEQKTVTLPLAQPTFPPSAEYVFLSHSGVQKNFVRQLYKDLTREGVSCFFDESRESLPLGEKWAPLIIEATETSRVAVLFLSMNFIRSKWPMLELSAFLKAKNSNLNLKLLPLFYKISPCDLKDLTSDTQDIPDQTRPEISEKTRIEWKKTRTEWNAISEETRIEWKKALREVLKIKGLRFNEGENKVSFREEIIKGIRNLLAPSGSVGLAKGQEVTLPLAKPTYPAWAVGLEGPVNRIMLELEKSKELAEAMVIYGFGGIGKTTLANAVVANLKLEGFNYTKIIIDQDPKQNDLKNIQQQLLEDVFPKYEHARKIRLRHCEEGRYHLTQAFQSEPNKPVFIFIDNALRAEDMQTLLPEDLGGLPQGSRILVTARDLSVTDLFEERDLSRRHYRVNTLADEHGEKILCNDPDKLKQIKDDVKKILRICGGIPLALKIVGAQLKKHKYRADNCSVILQALEKGEEVKKENLSERLFNFVYDSLETSVQEAFMDICSVLYIIFHRTWIEYIVGVNEVEILEEAALITAVPFFNSFDDIGKTRGMYFAGEDKLIVHDVILAIGRSMAKGTRIVDAQALFRAVEDQKVLQSIKGVGFNHKDESTYRLEESQLSCMSNALRVFCLGRRMTVTRCSSNTFQELRYLRIGGDVPCLPVNLEALPRLVFYVGPIFKEGFMLSKSLRYLQAVAQSNRNECATSEELNPIHTGQSSSLKELRLSALPNLAILLEGIHQFIELKILWVAGWDKMEELPAQVCQLRSLNKLMMWKWKSLKRLPESFSNLTRLTHLDLNSCTLLEGLCLSFGELRRLRYLRARECGKLTELPDSFGQLIALEYLDLTSCTTLTILPDNFGQLTALKYLNLFCCIGLKELPLNFGELRSLEDLDLRGCSELKELPSSFEDLRSLKILHKPFSMR